MVYAISDLHGHFDEYVIMLEKINFSEDDQLYILGDIVDGGDGGLRILQDIMGRKNITPILGEHDYFAYTVLSKIGNNINDESYVKKTSELLDAWLTDGGEATYNAFCRLAEDAQSNILHYIENFDVYKKIDVGQNSFILCHAVPDNFDSEKPLCDYEIDDFLFGNDADYSMQYFEDSYLVTGHTPTVFIDGAEPGRIFKGNRHIAIDCGMVLEETLGCICLDTLEEFYVE